VTARSVRPLKKGEVHWSSSGNRFLPQRARSSSPATDRRIVAILLPILLVGSAVFVGIFVTNPDSGTPPTPSLATLGPVVSDESEGSTQLAVAEQSILSGTAPAAIACSHWQGEPGASCSSVAAIGEIQQAGGGNPSFTQPNARFGEEMTYDPKDGYVVLFGGTNSSNGADTWIFSGGSWTMLKLTVHPQARSNAGMVYDAADRCVLMFGGLGSISSDYLHDTWEFERGKWTKLDPLTSPSARDGPGMTYDARDGYVVLFGGFGTSRTLSDTWMFEGGSWTKLSPARHPSERADVGMTYDARDGYVLMFGGYGNPGALRQTWAFAGGNWTLLAVGKAPEARGYPSMVYDPTIHAVLLFGGYSPSTVFNDTWKFEGGKWLQLHPTTSPPARGQAGIAFEGKSGYVVLFGGVDYDTIYGDTWSFGGNSWTELS
jgi:Galactose oxidase, central domain